MAISCGPRKELEVREPGARSDAEVRQAQGIHHLGDRCCGVVAASREQRLAVGSHRQAVQPERAVIIGLYRDYRSWTQGPVRGRPGLDGGVGTITHRPPDEDGLTARADRERRREHARGRRCPGRLLGGVQWQGQIECHSHSRFVQEPDRAGIQGATIGRHGQIGDVPFGEGHFLAHRGPGRGGTIRDLHRFDTHEAITDRAPDVQGGAVGRNGN